MNPCEESRRAVSGGSPEKGAYLLILPWSLESVGGVNEVVLNLARELRAQSAYEPVIAILSWSPMTVPKEVRGIPVVNLRLHDGYAAGAAAAAKSILRLPPDLIRISGFLRKHNVQVVNPHFPGFGACVFTMLRTLGLYKGKVLFSFHGSDIRQIEQFNRYLAAALRASLHAADALIPCSNSLGELLLRIAPEARIRCVHNGTDPEVFNVARAARTGRKRILNVGKFEHKKAQDVLLAAFGQLLDAGLDVELLMIGAAGPELEETRRLAARFGERVQMLTDIPHDRMPEYYASSDLFALPSRHEPFGIVLLEAGAAGLPVVATRVGGIPEFVRSESTGLLVEPDNAAMLAHAMRRVLADEALARALASAWHVEAMRFTWSRTARGYLDVLAECSAQSRCTGSR